MQGVCENACLVLAGRQKPVHAMFWYKLDVVCQSEHIARKLSAAASQRCACSEQQASIANMVQDPRSQAAPLQAGLQQDLPTLKQQAAETI